MQALLAGGALATHNRYLGLAPDDDDAGELVANRPLPTVGRGKGVGTVGRGPRPPVPPTPSDADEGEKVIGITKSPQLLHVRGVSSPKSSCCM